MDPYEDRFLSLNKHFEDKLGDLTYTIDSRLDKLFKYNESEREQPLALALPSDGACNQASGATKQPANPYSSHSFSAFKRPYIRDFRNFSAPTSDDKQIQQLTGSDDIDQLMQSKAWSRETKQQLQEAVLDHYAKLHVIRLIKQKNELLESPSKQNDDDVAQKLQLIEEQLEQVRARKELRIFVPENRLDTQIDWCAISAKLTSQHDAMDCRLMWSNQLHWSINSDSQWTEEEDICLINAVSKHGKNDWDNVASELNSGRLAWQCCARYNQEYECVRSPLDADEYDKIIMCINLCRIGNYVPWNQVMYFIKNHSLHQIKWQWKKYCSELRDASNWTKQEDYLLLRSVQKYGEKDWCRVAECVPGRSNKSCRERYIMRLKSATRAVGSWKKFEDTKLLSLVERFGTNWSFITSHMPERNCHQVRNRFELLKHEIVKPCPLKRVKLIRQDDGQFLKSGYRRKLSKEAVDANRRLREIFSTFSSVTKNSSKSSLTCRSAQDEVIYQSLVKVLCDRIMENRHPNRSMLETVIDKAIEPNPGLFMPCVPTIRAFKAWSLQQEYLKQFDVEISDETSLPIDDQVLKIIVSIFLFPALLNLMKSPQVNANDHQVGSLISRDSKNLYKIRDIQRCLNRWQVMKFLRPLTLYQDTLIHRSIGKLSHFMRSDDISPTSSMVKLKSIKSGERQQYREQSSLKSLKSGSSLKSLGSQTQLRMQIHPIRALQDNFMYLLVDDETKQAAAVDPVNASAMASAAADYGVDLKAILTTHHHYDHAHGNPDMVTMFPDITVYGGDYRIPSLTRVVAHGEVLKLGSLSIECLATPCHTKGHICYYVTSAPEGHSNDTSTAQQSQTNVDTQERAVFTGDTLFIAGCGRFFEGSSEQMNHNLNVILGNLPSDTRVYCGHEYTVTNLKFALTVEPQNLDIKNKLDWASNKVAKREPTVPSTIGEEKKINPFMRLKKHQVKKFTGETDELEAMTVLRHRKNEFVP